MATIGQIRGALLEEAVLYLLLLVGYEPIELVRLTLDDKGYLRSGHSGLEARGRGTWHQVDALAASLHSPAFIYPLRLIVEAKCYQRASPVGLPVARGAVGVLKDIAENYFTYDAGGGVDPVFGPRYHYAAAIFSATGFTRGAVEYAIAHQVFLITYEDVPVIQPLVRAILEFDESCVSDTRAQAIQDARSFLRAVLHQRDEHPAAAEGLASHGGNVPTLTPRGRNVLIDAVAACARRIRGSYFGMLQGRWPMHLLREEPLPEAAFENDLVDCRVLRSQEGAWKFVPNNTHEEDRNWFSLEFNLPALIAELVQRHADDRVAVADLKQQHFSYIDLSGVIGNIRRNVRLQLNQQWIAQVTDRYRFP